MTIHNSAGANQLKRMGFERVVLARELTLEEIERIAAHTSIQLEIFCARSPLLFLLGTLPGEQLSRWPERPRGPLRSALYDFASGQGHKEGFFLSCNDLCAFTSSPKDQGYEPFRPKDRGKAQVRQLYRPGGSSLFDSFWTLRPTGKTKP